MASIFSNNNQSNFKDTPPTIRYEPKLYQDTLQKCSDIYPQECCDCMFKNDTSNDCYQKFGIGCEQLAKSKCAECGGACSNICDPDYGSDLVPPPNRSLATCNEIIGNDCINYLRDLNIIPSVGLGSSNEIVGIECSRLIGLLCGNSPFQTCEGTSGLCSRRDRPPIKDSPCIDFCDRCHPCPSGGSNPVGGATEQIDNPGGSSGEDDGNNNGCAGQPCDPPDPNDCRQCIAGLGVPRSEPLDIMYRHTACHFIWYPPEYAFGGDPNVTQCQGFQSRGQGGGNSRVLSCNPDATPTGNGTVGASPSLSLFDRSCEAGYSPELWPLRPCNCRKFAHLKGGLTDTVFKRENISTKPFSYGYLPFMNPFATPMNISEIGCCWCASPDKLPSSDSVNDRIFATSWPKAAQKYGAGNFGAAGAACTPYTPGENNDPVTYNSKYQKSCFAYGISPYLQRLALLGDPNYGPYKSGFDIWTFGGTDQIRDLGPLYSVYQFLNITQPGSVNEYTIKYREITGQKSRLRDSLVGFITLEHHFEAWAHRSNDGALHPDLVPNLNHANVLTTPFERAYSGYITPVGAASQGISAKFKYHPEEALRWSLMRTTPRRFMYVGSQIPLFHFDLYAFQDYSINNNYVVGGGYFDSARFLKAYYNYFYSLSEKPSQSPTNASTPIKIGGTVLIDDYNYVIESLEGMVVAGILRVKDHAIDIATETTQIIQSASYDNDGELVLNPYVSAVVGGASGYMALVEFLGVEPITGSVTPKIIKQKLLPNFNGTGSEPTKDMFMFPRRATLPVYLEGNRVAAWGCKNNSCSDFNYNQSVVPGRLIPGGSNIPANEQWITKSIVSVYSGLNTNYFITYNGKIAASGYSLDGLAEIPEDIGVQIDNETANSDTKSGFVKKLGGKGIGFEIALIEYPEFYDYNYCNVSGSPCEYSNGGDICGPGFPPPERDPNAPLPQYKLRSWGDNHCEYGTFIIGNNDLLNKTHRWADVANGGLHTSAISSYGNLYTVGDNAYSQLKYGNQSETLFLGALSTHLAKPGFVSDNEFDVAIDPNNINSFAVELNGITYVNLNRWCQYPSTQEVPPADKRCKLLDPENLDVDLPIFTNIGSGNYHSVAIQSDNQVRVWGKYLYLNPLGTPYGTPYDTFVPAEVKALADKWDVSYYGASELPSGDYSYISKGATLASIHSENDTFLFADGGPDYTMVANNNTVYVWGRTEMLPTWKSTDTESTFGSWSKSFDGEIIRITAGANGFAVLYKLNNETSNAGFGNNNYRVNKTYIWTRKGQETPPDGDKYGLIPTDDEDISEFGYSDIAFGYGHAIALKYANIAVPTWDYDDFKDPEAKKNQFLAGSSNIPKYFKRQAFFRAVPGAWDFSKWLWGGYCSFAAEGFEANNPVLARDLCSVLGEPDPTDATGLKNDNYSYSGHPEYYWMSPLLRRYQNFVPNHSVQPSTETNECLTYAAFGSAITNPDLAGMNSGVNGAASSCPEKADVCWQATGLPQQRTSTYWAPQNPDCSGVCDNSCDRSACIRNCCPSTSSTTLSDTCTTCIGRIGFNSSKDYFIQSYKNFSRQRNCCRVIYTNISYVNYASRLTYFGWDSASATFKIFFTKDPYRFSDLIPSNANTSYKLANGLIYPYVYLGGEILKKLWSSFFTAIYGDDGTGRTCENTGDVCLARNPKETILGPGGWLWASTNSPTGRPSTNEQGDFVNSIWSYPVAAPLLSPYALLGAYTYGGTSTGAIVPDGSTIPTDIKIFNPDNPNAYAPVYGSPSSTKWHKINVTRPNIYAAGDNEFSNFDPIAFQGGVEEGDITGTANIVFYEYYINSIRNIIIKSGNINCIGIDDG
jgi:hypothetical protein